MIFKAPLLSRALKPVAALASLAPLFMASAASAATIIATPGEQNTQSGENGCETEPCAGGHWLHYPELLQKSLGATYMVMQNGDGGAVLGCDAASATVAGGNSFCKSTKFTDSEKGPPNIAIIGPFGEHDQRIIAGANEAMYGNQAAFEGAYEGLVQDYLKLNAKVYMMTPIDVPWGGTQNLTSGKNIVKDFMLPAALKIAANHSLKVIDTYTAISGTPQLQTMYYGTDGQVTMAGQQKMADLIIAALNDNSGGAGGAGGAGGGGGAGGVAGGAGGASAGAGGVATGGVATAGTAGSFATAGASTAGTGGAPTGAGGTGPTGTSGTTTALGGTAPVMTTAPASDSGGCSLSNANGAGWGAGLALLGLALGALGRRRRQ